MGDVAEQLKQALAFIDRIGAELLSRRCTDWYPEGVHDAAVSMCNDMGSLADECIQFDVGPVEQPQPTGPTVRCRIAVGIDSDGEWGAYGGNEFDSDDDLRRDIADQCSRYPWQVIHIIEADVPLPQRVEPEVIQGRVVQ